MDLIKYRPHQMYTIIQTLNMISSSVEPINVVWGHVARSGKSYMMHGIIDALDEYYDHDNQSDDIYLIITTAPNETIQQYIQIMNSLKERGLRIITKKEEFVNVKSKCVIIASKQLMTHTSNRDLLIRDPKLILIDEAHFGGSTSLCSEMLKKYPYSSKIYISATYEKIMNSIKTKNILKWDLEDIQLAKRNQFDKIDQKYIDFHKSIEAYEQKYKSTDYHESYRSYPDMNMIGLNLDCISENTDEWDKSPSTLFKFDKNTNELLYPNSIRLVFDHIFDKVIADLDNLNDTIDQRNILDKHNPTTIICFLPQKNISTISHQVEAIVSHLDYLQICLCNTTDSTDRIGSNIASALEVAKKKKKKAVLALSGSQGHLGITIDTCDVVVLLNNSTSYDFLCQTMFRCMSESNRKKNGYIIDVNVKRALRTISKYGKQISSQPIEHIDSIERVISGNTISFAFSDEIQFEDSKATIDRIKADLQN